MAYIVRRGDVSHLKARSTTRLIAVSRGLTLELPYMSVGPASEYTFDPKETAKTMMLTTCQESQPPHPHARIKRNAKFLDKGKEEDENGAE